MALYFDSNFAQVADMMGRLQEICTRPNPQTRQQGSLAGHYCDAPIVPNEYTICCSKHA